MRNRADNGEEGREGDGEAKLEQNKVETNGAKNMVLTLRGI